MTRRVWTIAAAVCIISTFAGRAAAQDSSAVKRDSARTTLSGVYTDAQAKRGSQTYANICVSCHQPSEHTGDGFNKDWNLHPLSELFVYLYEKMPKDNPGSMDGSDTADIIAFLLKLNGMPPGTADLPADSLALKKIMIDTRSSRPSP